MKKILLVVVCVAVISGAFAQKTHFGVKAGLNLAELTDIGGEMKPSFYVGAFGILRLTNSVCFQPEIQYSRQGSYSKETRPFGSIKTWVIYEYLNIPLLIKLCPTNRLSIELGPQFGFLLDANYKVKQGGVTQKASLDTSSDSDIAIILGASYMFTDNIGISARYNYGLTSTIESNYYILGEKAGKNRVIQIGMMYRF